MTRAALADQPTLWDPPGHEHDELPAHTTVATRRRTHPALPDPTRDEIRDECQPTCLGCGKDEGRGLCTPRCMVICTRLPANDVADVCIITTRVTAKLITGIHGYEPGRKLALVTCPHCRAVHWHTPRFGTHYRIPLCGQPYMVTLHRPRITSGAAPNASQNAQNDHRGDPDTPHATTTTRGATAARAALTGAAQ